MAYEKQYFRDGQVLYAENLNKIEQGIADALNLQTKVNTLEELISEKAQIEHGNHVPDAQSVNNAVFLRNDNTWQTVTPANIGASAIDHKHSVADITDLHATAVELNYMDGVTSNVQVQLDTKVAQTSFDEHISDETVHITTAERTAWNAKSNFSGSYHDLTDKPAIPSVDGLATVAYVDSVASNKINRSEIDDRLSGKADTTHDHNDDYYTKTQIDEHLLTKADKVHDHNDKYFTKEEINAIELISVDEIDGICGATIQVASLNEVTF